VLSSIIRELRASQRKELRMKKGFTISIFTFILQGTALAQTQSFIRSKTITAPMCGVASINVGSGPQCGEPTITWVNNSSANCAEITASDSRCSPKEYNVGRGAACGVERYKQGTAFECGADNHEFWSGWGDSCPGSTVVNGSLGPVTIPKIIGFDKEVRVHRSGWKVSTQTRERCRGQKPRTCRHAKFGVEVYKQCNMGVKSYNTCVVGYDYCRHSAHGEESRVYPTCQHESFGVNYNSCSIPDIENQSAEISRFEAELKSYKVAVESLKSGIVPSLQILELSKQALNQNIFALQESVRDLSSQLNPETSQDAKAFIEMKIGDANASITLSQEAISRIDLCISGNGTCDFATEVAVKSIEAQIQNVHANLILIRDHLTSEYNRLAGVAEDIRSQIQELLNKLSLISG
jgi:hypothetical protein